ncbi:unnamed protein product, partial [Symbiodinium natans]
MATMGSSGPKMGSKGPEMGSKGPEMGSKGPEMGSGGPKMGSGGPKLGGGMVGPGRMAGDGHLSQAAPPSQQGQDSAWNLVRQGIPPQMLPDNQGQGGRNGGGTQRQGSQSAGGQGQAATGQAGSGGDGGQGQAATRQTGSDGHGGQGQAATHQTGSDGHGGQGQAATHQTGSDQHGGQGQAATGDSGQAGTQSAASGVGDGGQQQGHQRRSDQGHAENRARSLPAWSRKPRVPRQNDGELSRTTPQRAQNWEGSAVLGYLTPNVVRMAEQHFDHGAQQVLYLLFRVREEWARDFLRYLKNCPTAEFPKNPSAWLIHSTANVFGGLRQSFDEDAEAALEAVAPVGVNVVNQATEVLTEILTGVGVNLSHLPRLRFLYCFSYEGQTTAIQAHYKNPEQELGGWITSRVNHELPMVENRAV